MLLRLLRGRYARNRRHRRTLLLGLRMGGGHNGAAAGDAHRRLRRKVAEGRGDDAARGVRLLRGAAVFGGRGRVEG